MRHRLWFRLHHVLPLAEHALACVEHRLTGTQAQARAAGGPALIWTSTPNADQLTSNGVPVWYGPHGTVHAAEALSWQNAAGQPHRDRPAGHTGAYLPMSDRLVDLLRSAGPTGRTWVTIDIDPADEHLIDTNRIDVVASRHDLVPAGTRWIPATVTCPEVDNRPYPALIADGYTTTSGALLARFDRTTIGRISDHLADLYRDSYPMPGEYPTLHWSGTVLIVSDDQDDGTEVTRHISDRITADPPRPLPARRLPVAVAPGLPHDRLACRPRTAALPAHPTQTCPAAKLSATRHGPVRHPTAPAACTDTRHRQSTAQQPERHGISLPA